MLLQLRAYRTSTLAELITERNRVVSIVNSLDEDLLLIDQNRRVIVANPVVSNLLGIPLEQLENRAADEVAQENDLLREMLRHLDLSPNRCEADPPLPP